MVFPIIGFLNGRRTPYWYGSFILLNFIYVTNSSIYQRMDFAVHFKHCCIINQFDVLETNIPKFAKNKHFLEQTQKCRYWNLKFKHNIKYRKIGGLKNVDISFMIVSIHYSCIKRLLYFSFDFWKMIPLHLFLTLV